MSATTADQAELAKFDRPGADWWNPDGPFCTLHDINPARLDYIERQVGGLDGKRVLDIGCGGGLLAEAMAERGARVTAIDLAETALAAAREHATARGLDIDYRLQDAAALAAEAPAAFTVVTCLELLEHVPEPDAPIAAAATLVAPGGWVIFSTLNRTPRAFFGAIVAAEYLFGLLPRGTHDYARFIRPSELAAAARTHGLEPVDVTGLCYDPWRRRARLARDVSINYLLCCRRPPAA
ncbi:MAG: ubiquinone biosynthesis O-methyltransferase [Gammaproteobacteria bacterium]|nr:MAG: ubiquinone biosynthesis O-methyltransferase [Gammaproteobacteria bacterium]